MNADTEGLLDFLKALASNTRQKVLFLFLDQQERTVNQVAEEAEIGQSTASVHLAMLKRGGLLKSRRDGKEVYYLPDRARIIQHLDLLRDMLTACCPPE